MSKSFVTYTGDGVTTTFTFSFEYLDQSHVKATVDGTEVPFTFNSANSVTLSSAPATGTQVRIFRETPGVPLVDFENGSVLLAENLDTAAIQAIFRAQEAADTAGRAIFPDGFGDWDARNKPIKNVGEPTEPQDAVTKNWAETAMSSELAQANAAKNAAQTSEANAKTSETNAAASEAAAAASSDAAYNSRIKAYQWAEETHGVEVGPGLYSAKHHATESANSATAAATSETNAAASASAAATSEANAASSETAAANSASAAAASEANAASSEAKAQDLADRFLATSASIPTTRDDGTPLQAGDLYLNTTDSTIYKWDGSQWIASAVDPSLYYTKQEVDSALGGKANTSGTYPGLSVGDADTLDGLHGSALIQKTAERLLSDADLNSISDGFYAWSGGGGEPANAPEPYMGLFQTVDGSQKIQVAFGGVGSGELYVRRADGGTFYPWTRFWNAANDGSGSGLDADLLDGRQGSGYVNTDYNTSLNSDSRNTYGVTRLYRRDDNSPYNVQVHYDGRWFLRGYQNDTFHAECKVDYANNAGNADTLDGYHASSLLTSQSTTMSHVANAAHSAVGAHALVWVSDAVNPGNNSSYVYWDMNAYNRAPGTWMILCSYPITGNGSYFRVLAKRIA